MLPKHLYSTVERLVGDKAFWTSSGALRTISYHPVRNSLHCRCDYRTLAYVRLQIQTNAGDKKGPKEKQHDLHSSPRRRPWNILSRSSPAPPPGSVMRQPACSPSRVTARSSSPAAVWPGPRKPPLSSRLRPRNRFSDRWSWIWTPRPAFNP